MEYDTENLLTNAQLFDLAQQLSEKLGRCRDSLYETRLKLQAGPVSEFELDVFHASASIGFSNEVHLKIVLNELRHRMEGGAPQLLHRVLTDYGDDFGGSPRTTASSIWDAVHYEIPEVGNDEEQRGQGGPPAER